MAWNRLNMDFAAEIAGIRDRGLGNPGQSFDLADLSSVIFERSMTMITGPEFGCTWVDA